MPCPHCDDLGVVLEPDGQWAACPDCNCPTSVVALFVWFSAAALVSYAGLFLALVYCR